jgi:CMP-N-acetylneuraminic acid synthetase
MILGLIPARGGSKGIPDKNIKPLNGKPLIAYTIEAALKSQLLTQVVVSTDSNQIASVAQKYGATIPFKRPLDLAQDDTPALSVVQHAITQLFTMPLGKEDIVILLQPTSPLRTTQHIDEAITVLLQRPDATAVVSVHPARRHPSCVVKINRYYGRAMGLLSLASRHPGSLKVIIFMMASHSPTQWAHVAVSILILSGIFNWLNGL